MPVKMDTGGLEIRNLEAFGVFNGPKILEIGCGDGRVTAALMDKADFLAAVDPNQRDLRAAVGRIAGAHFVAAPKVEVVDTVGAGDTFNAGVLTELQRTGFFSKTSIGHLPEAAVAGAAYPLIIVDMKLGARDGADLIAELSTSGVGDGVDIAADL